MILAVKNHNKITDEIDLRGISIIITEYCYLGMAFDMSQADFTLTWKNIKKRSNYLCANMRYYSKDL